MAVQYMSSRSVKSAVYADRNWHLACPSMSTLQISPLEIVSLPAAVTEPAAATAAAAVLGLDWFAGPSPGTSLGYQAGGLSTT
jgi:hypothetical protein